MKENGRAFAEFLGARSGLHDARVLAIVRDEEQRALSLHVDDIQAKFRGLPGYSGAVPTILEMTEIQFLKLSLTTTEPLWIAEFAVDPGTPNRASITFYPGGRIAFEFGGVHLPSIGGPPTG